MFQIIFTGITFGIVALIMFVIGISQIRSKEPVGFYSGIKPPDREELTDVGDWNKKHGMMYIAYGICIVVSWVCGLVIGDSI